MRIDDKIVSFKNLTRYGLIKTLWTFEWLKYWNSGHTERLTMIVKKTHKFNCWALLTTINR